MKYPVIIFDWDGTLMDSIGKIVVCMQRAADSVALPVPTEAQVRDIIGLSLDKAMTILFPEHTKVVQEQVRQAYREQYLQSTDHLTPFYPGVKEWLFALKAQGYTLAVATGKGRGGLNRVLSEHQVKDLFTVTYCADEANSKPDPLMLNKILADLNIHPTQALMIGDSSYDLEMANNANMACVGVSYGVHCNAVLAQYKPLAILADLPTQLADYI